MSSCSGGFFESKVGFPRGVECDLELARDVLVPRPLQYEEAPLEAVIMVTPWSSYTMAKAFGLSCPKLNASARRSRCWDRPSTAPSDSCIFGRAMRQGAVLRSDPTGDTTHA